MTSKDIEAELTRDPFVPLRFHLVSGKVIDVAGPGRAFLIQNALLVLHPKNAATVRLGGYDVVDFRNIERIQHRASASGRKRTA
jgi:hypothetical protein